MKLGHYITRRGIYDLFHEFPNKLGSKEISKSKESPRNPWN